MGLCLGRSNEGETSVAPIRSHMEPDWSSIKSIVVYGIPKNVDTDSMEWEVIESVRIESHPVHSGDARVVLTEIINSKRHGKNHFVHSLYYQLLTEMKPSDIVIFDTLAYLSSEQLHPSASFRRICESYFDDKKLLEIKRMSMC